MCEENGRKWRTMVKQREIDRQIHINLYFCICVFCIFLYICEENNLLFKQLHFSNFFISYMLFHSFTFCFCSRLSFPNFSSYADRGWMKFHWCSIDNSLLEEFFDLILFYSSCLLLGYMCFYLSHSFIDVKRPSIGLGRCALLWFQ